MIFLQNNILYLEQNHKRALALLFILSIIYIIPIMIANFEYIDDLGRSLLGNTDWTLDGRPLVTVISIIFSNSTVLMDTSPWLQIVSVFLLDYTIILWLKKIYRISIMGYPFLCWILCLF